MAVYLRFSTRLKPKVTHRHFFSTTLRISSSVRPIVNYIMCASGFDPDLETGPDVIMMMVCQYFRETNRSTYKFLFIKPGNTFEDFNGRSK